MNTGLMDQPCPIWDTPSAVSGVSVDDPDRTADWISSDLIVNSPRAGGQYFVDAIAKNELATLNERDKVKLTSWLEEQRSFGISIPKITSISIFEAQQRKELRIAERVDGILRYLESKLRGLGKIIQIGLFRSVADEELTEDHLILFDLLRHSGSVDSNELTSLLKYLEECGYIDQPYASMGSIQTYSLTTEGYERLEEIEKPYQDSANVFVAMWFHPSMYEVWDKGIKPAITEAGYKPVRIDQKEHMNKIDDEIIAEIRRSRFVVADFTHGKINDNDLPIAKRGARGGVYYEAGFAQGLGIDVIFTCRKDQISDVHFDTRQFNHIAWKTPEDLKKKLTQRISAVFGDGPLKNSGC